MNARQRRTQRLGNALTWLCGGALALNLLLVVGLLALIAWYGTGYFWQEPVVAVQRVQGPPLLGEVLERQPIPDEHGRIAHSPGDRIRLRVGNRDVTGTDFLWVEVSSIRSADYPDDAVLLERLEWGNFYGFIRAIRRGGETLARGEAQVRDVLPELHQRKLEQLDTIHELEDGPIGEINYELERLRLDLRKLELEEDLAPAERERRREQIETFIAARQAEYERLAADLADMRAEFIEETVLLETIDGAQREIPVGHIVRVVRPNELGLGGKLALYASRVWEFVSAEPRESNTEGGIFPAIFGTVMMVFLMSFAVTPLGVLAAIYLREYARQGAVTRAVRIAVNNLAGVPSIVFGVFGLGFFVYLIGGTIDQIFYPEALPTPTYGTGGIFWAALTLALLTVPVVIVATEEGLAAVPRIVRQGSLALGATKFETTWKVVVPAAAPGILTGMILAMARAAGEVAPLMIVGMVKLAPALPIDDHFPFVHLERKFMHLGFHIYDVGFQSPNVEATKPLVFATALLLIVVVMAMNLLAIAIRNHLRRKYTTSGV
jgi:phosphate transport system permease protein